MCDLKDEYNVKGAVLYVDSKPVAMTLGSEISPKVYDINFEKALREYDGVYAVINNEFAKTLTQYEYINREEDMGLEGLKSLNFHIIPLLSSTAGMQHRKNDENDISQNRKIRYRKPKKLWLSCFDEDQTAVNLIFDSDLFDGCCAVVDDRIVSALYLVKGTLNGEKSHYLCGASTDKSFRGNGIMSRLIDFALNDAKNNGDVYSLLFPANDGLYGFYTKLGYALNCTVKAVKFQGKRLKVLQRRA